jgi:uncharacterized iron-regulated membrane protein
MSNSSSIQNQTQILRTFRKIHRITGAFLFLFFFIVAITGLLLGWKKNSGGLLLAETKKGTSSELKNWQSLDSLHKVACQVLKDSVSKTLSVELERIDIRKDKGVAKFVFSEHYTGIQLDGQTAKLLSIEQRRSDFIEQIHDGSFVDRYLGIKGFYFKLLYTSIMGLALITFTVTGFWLWYGPKRLKRIKNV